LPIRALPRPSFQQLPSDSASFRALPLWRVLASPPPTYSDYVDWARAAEVASGATPPEQSDEHLLGVSEVWETTLM